MSKSKKSKLDPFVDKLDEWFGIEKIDLAEAQKRLAQMGCVVSTSRLSEFWQSRERLSMQAALLGQIASGAQACKEVEAELRKNPAPQLDTIIGLHRVLIMKLSTQANVDPAMFKLLAGLMKPVMDSAKLEAKRIEIDLSVQKYRDQVAERKAAIERELGKAKSGTGITAETIERIEKELRLL